MRITLTDLHVVAIVEERGEYAFMAARELDDAIYELTGRELPARVIRVDDKTGRISLDTVCAHDGLWRLVDELGTKECVRCGAIEHA